MPDPVQPTTPAAPVESAASVASTPADSSTASIVQETLGSLNDEGEGSDPSFESSQSPDASTPAASPEVDALAAELGIAPGSKNNRIPYHRVQKIVENARKKAADEHAAALKTHTDKLSAYEQRIAEVSAVEQMILSNPEKFVQSLVNINPAYEQYFGGNTSGRPAASNGQPQPDLQLQDGSLTYSQTGLQRLMDWQAQQTEQRIAQRFAPMEAEHRSRAIYAAALPKVQAQMAEAEKWPLFTEHKADILKALQSDAKIGLTEAYQRVVIPKLASNRDTMRAEVLAELKGRPHSTATIPSSAAAVPADAGPLDTNAIVRRALSELK